MHGHFYALTFAVAVTGYHGHPHGHRGNNGRKCAGGGQRQEQWLFGLVVGLVGAGGSRDYALPAAFVAVGTVFAKSRNGAVQQLWVCFGKSLVADTQAVGNAGPVILDYDVSLLGKRHSIGLSLRRFQVQDNRTLASVPGGKGRLASSRVAAGTLNFNNLGALIAE